MTLPHEHGFAFRPHAFWAASLASLAIAARVPGLGARDLTAGLAGAAILAVVLYQYTRWLVRLDGRFRTAHPRKIHATTIIGFYAPLVVAGAFVCSPWLASFPRQSPLEVAAPYLAVPGLLASSAGALHGGRESGVLT
jgi:hypothetical protein